MITNIIFKVFIKEFIFFHFITGIVLILNGLDFSKSLIRGKNYGYSQ